MKVRRPEFLPDPERSRAEMEDQQRSLARVATFADHLGFDHGSLAIESSVSLDDRDDATGTEPIVAGVDQAFLEDEAVSAVVAIQNGQIVDSACGRSALSIPYIPGLLAFREGGPIIDALGNLSVDPDLLLFDGSGRIHFREAGIATHVGVIFDVPAIGVAKNLLCGRPTQPLENHLEAGERVPIEADEEVSVPPGTVLGYVFQSRQFPDPQRRHVNPIFVSPGHRVGAETGVSITERLCAGYKLPEPIRLADLAAEDCKG